MKQETTNTFDKGLNKDLNPIVTPNNVLTDCLNGTFITFNGDELTLQNDSGNTTIAIPESGEVVKLSKDFYPLGMKEYGGILYIVSGKKGNIGNKREDETYIRIGDSDAVENFIEFGSYPSPENMSSVAKTGIKNAITVKNLNDLYKTKIINNYEFKSGGYVIFSPEDGESTINIDESILWTPSRNALYKIFLIHQLDNGSIDLTEDIWTKYLEYKKKTLGEPEHWINSNTFKYFCPNRYKGRLGIIIKLSEPVSFRLSSAPRVETSPEKVYLYFDVYWDNGEPTMVGETATWPIEIIGWKIRIKTQEEEVVDRTPESLLKPVEIDKNSKYFSYEIIPDTQYDWEAFPEEFKDKFSIRGNMLLEYLLMGLNLKLGGGVCQVSPLGFKIYNIAILSDSDGPLNNLLEPITESSSNNKKAVFVEKSYTKDLSAYNVIGKYSIVEGKMVLITEVDSDYANFKLTLPEDKIPLLEEFEAIAKLQTVVLEDNTCLEVLSTFTFGYNPKRVSFKWAGESLPSIHTVKKGTLDQYTLTYKPDTDLMITTDFQTITILSADIKLGDIINVIEATPLRLITTTAQAGLSYIGYSETYFLVGNGPNFSVTFEPPTTVINTATLTIKYTLNDTRGGNPTPIAPYPSEITWGISSYKLTGVTTKTEVSTHGENQVVITVTLQADNSWRNPEQGYPGMDIPIESLPEYDILISPEVSGLLTVVQRTNTVNSTFKFNIRNNRLEQ